MTKDRHKQILKVCRNAWVTFHKVKNQSCNCQERYLFLLQNMFAKDQTGAYNLLPIKEQCGVKDPYVMQYGKEAGTMRNFTYHDTCACVKDPSKNQRFENIYHFTTHTFCSQHQLQSC